MFNSKVINIISIIVTFLGLSMIPSLFWSLYYNETDVLSFLYSILITISFGLLLFFLSKIKINSSKNNDLGLKDGFTIVSVGWIFMGLFSSLPYYISLDNFSFTNSFFEAMSGLTTTGASVLGGSTVRIEELSHGLLFWRSFTHFIGGMGIIVFSIAILPLLGIGGVQLFKAEVAGPAADKITPRIKQTAKLLWSIYVGFVLVETIILKLLGMSFFDAICHSFATMATGGFSTHSESIKYFNSPGIEWAIILFMFIAATNFSMHYFFIAKKKFDYFKNEEFKVYFFAFVFISFSIFVNISLSSVTNYTLGLESLRHSMFTTISLLSTTGFGTENFELWPNYSKMIIFVLFFLGGCAGSTTGGLKLIRSVLVFKYLFYEMKRLIHPSGVYTIKIGNNIIDDNIIKNTLGFYLFYIFIFIITAIIFSVFNIDITTSLTASASAIGNIGPGLGQIGPYDNWGHFPSAVKWISCFCMLLGRLEIFTVMILFSRLFWKH